MTQLIETQFGKNDAMNVEPIGGKFNAIKLGFYGQDGVTVVTHFMTSEAAMELCTALQEAVREQGGVVLKEA